MTIVVLCLGASAYLPFDKSFEDSCHQVSSIFINHHKFSSIVNINCLDDDKKKSVLLCCLFHDLEEDACNDFDEIPF